MLDEILSCFLVYGSTDKGFCLLGHATGGGDLFDFERYELWCI
jgi:hypothetical protein